MKKDNERYTLNIMILDDVISNLVELSKIVTAIGYKARPVVSPVQGMKAIETCVPNLILLDTSMPEMSGFEFLKRLKANERYKDIPVMFVTADNKVSFKVKAFELGAVDYVTMPFEVEELSARIRMHTQSKLILDRLKYQNDRLQKLLESKEEVQKEEKERVVSAFVSLLQSSTCCVSRLDKVSSYAKVISSALQLVPKYEEEVNDNFVHIIEKVAPLYDIGMLSVDASIIKKPGKLSNSEMSVVKQHTSYGIQPLSQLYKQDQNNEYLKMAMDVAMYHHERYDGQGYPYGIVKHKIPLSARIVSLVTVYEALTRDTTYRRALDYTETVKIINQEAGYAFDPDLVEVFNRVSGQLEAV